MKRRAFTLIELLVVISIIALLSSVVLASLNGARERGRLAGIRSFAAQVDHIAGEQAVGIWDLNDCSGTTVVDRSGYNNFGTANGLLGWSATDTPSGTGCSYGMNGTTQSITISGPYGTTVYDFGSTTDFTLAAWVKATSLSNGPFIIDKRHTYGGTAGGYTLRLDSTTGRPCLRIGDGVGVFDLCASSGTYTDGKWHHFVASAERAGNAVFYGDGQSIGSVSMAGIGNIDRADQGVFFGTKDGTAANAINGLMDDIRIYAKKLTAQEVGALYAAEAAGHDVARAE